MKKIFVIIALLWLSLTATPAQGQAPAPDGREYIVQAGDSLSAIAIREYGDAQAFRAIVEATNAKAAEDDAFTLITDPALISAGQKLWLPASPQIIDLIPPPSPAFAAAWRSISCDTFNLPREVAFQSDCGYVTVPEFHSQPAGPAIQVAVVRTRSFSDAPFPDPIFMEQGGPGGTTIGLYPALLPYYDNLQSLLDNRDLVFVEQRGTLYSQPSLLCPEETVSHLAQALGVLEEGDATYLRVCRDRLLAEGVNFDAFNSVENAADMYAVAETLGYDYFNFYGTSYGTLLGQYVIAQAGSHTAQLRGVIIDAVVAPDVNFNARIGDTASYALRNLFAACAQDQVCNRDFPDLEQVFLALVDRLNQQPVSITLTVPELFSDRGETIESTFDGRDFIDVVFGNLYSTRQSRLLPRHIYQTAHENDFNWLVRSMSDKFLPGTTARGMYFTVLCARQNALVNDGAFFGAPYDQLQYMNNDEDFTQGCQMMDVRAEEAFRFDNPNTPTLILNGAYDPATPQPYGEYVGSLLNTAYVYTFPGVGHGSLLDNDCAAGIVQNFLANPAQPPDSGCLSEVKPIFYGRITPLAELTLAEQTLDNGVIIALPSQWARRRLGVFVDPNDTGTARTGTVLVTFVPVDSLEGAIAALGDNVVELAREVALGNNRWTILEDVTTPLVQRFGLTLIPETGQILLVRLLVDPTTADDVVATLWEPMLGSVRVVRP